jgi:peptidoglycan/xylan/chitin deacetylase (PgdA/CDA1 family)
LLPTLARPVAGLAKARVRAGQTSERIGRLFGAKTMRYRRGAQRVERGRERVVVLAYHAIRDLRTDAVLSEYGVRPEQLEAHLDGLGRAGWRFVSLEALIAWLDAETPLAPRSVLVTFDDAYDDLLDVADRILRARGIPAVTFVVAGKIGQTNDWDASLGGRSLPLLDVAGLRAVRAAGVAVGSHGMTHRRLVDLATADVVQELQESAEELASLGNGRPRAFSYPYGLWSNEVAAAVRESGYEVAFAIDPGAVSRRGRYWQPRIEVRASDTPRSLRLKVATAHWPRPLRSITLRLLGTS